MIAEIVPTILTSNLTDYVRKVNLLKGIVDRVHLDIIDGRFVDNQTISLESLKNYEISLKIDLHLMVKEPEDWVHRALEILPDRILGQVEMMYDPARFIQTVIDGGARVGLAIDLETPLSVMSEEIYHLADIILLLGVKAGRGGQAFDQRVLAKIAEMRKIVGDWVDLGVDGGLDEKNISLCQKAGANIFYIGNHFWQAPDLSKNYQELVSLVKQ